LNLNLALFPVYQQKGNQARISTFNSHMYDKCMYFTKRVAADTGIGTHNVPTKHIYADTGIGTHQTMSFAMVAVDPTSGDVVWDDFQGTQTLNSSCPFLLHEWRCGAG
jgi:hypothetical protein